MIVYLYELLNMKMTGAGILGFEDNRVKIDGDLVLRQGRTDCQLSTLLAFILLGPIDFMASCSAVFV